MNNGNGRLKRTVSLRILTGKKVPSNKTPALTKSVNKDIWVVSTSKSTL